MDGRGDAEDGIDQFVGSGGGVAEAFKPGIGAAIREVVVIVVGEVLPERGGHVAGCAHGDEEGAVGFGDLEFFPHAVGFTDGDIFQFIAKEKYDGPGL